jgi:iron complex transport system substrate-binding protein
MKRRALALLLLLAAFSAAWLLARARIRGTTPGAGDLRVVSLSPAITETLFSLGKGPAVVGVSDYCNRPDEVARLPHTGSGLTPNYEAITRLDPTLILAEANASTRRESLAVLAPTELLPWLTLGEMTSSIRRLGVLTRSSARADALATRLATRLSVPAPSGAPRVLLVLGYDPGRLSEVWFIKQNSLHGAALHAAGGQNAVARDEPGPPRLSIAEVIALDPDQVIILAPDGKTPSSRWLDEWHRLTPLRAVSNKRISVLRSAAAFGNGPSILELVDALRPEIQRLGAPLPR